VCHACDTPACINPDHLFLGTKTDNNRDRDLKNRQFKKLSNAAVEAIIASDETQQALADRYGVNQGTISKIKSGARRVYANRPEKQG